MPTWEQLQGPLAGVACSALWAATSIAFTEAGRRLGATRVNLWRLWIAFALHAAVFCLFHGVALPDVHPRQLTFLAISGVIGFAICDQALFLAFLMIGPRRTLLIQLTAPIFGLLLGVLFAADRLTLPAILGIALTLGGIAWTVLERQPTRAQATPATPNLRLGVALAILGAFTQALGSLLAKLGMSADGLADAAPISPQTSALLRLPFGALATMAVYYAMRSTIDRRKPPRIVDPRALRLGLAFAAIGAITGPFLGVWCAQTAIEALDLGVAQTLLSLAPVFIIPLVVLIYGEHVSLRAIGGAVIALAGAAVLSLAPGRDTTPEDPKPPAPLPVESP